MVVGFKWCVVEVCWYAIVVVFDAALVAMVMVAVVVLVVEFDRVEVVALSWTVVVDSANIKTDIAVDVTDWIVEDTCWDDGFIDRADVERTVAEVRKLILGHYLTQHLLENINIMAILFAMLTILIFAHV